jgi:hypothetical protein
MDVYASSALPSPMAVFAAAGSVIALTVGAAVAFARARHRAALARAAAEQVGEQPPLVDGRDVVLAGVVRHVDDHDVAVKVSITQEGTESETSGSWYHKWTEVDRTVAAAPFLLELADGQLVRVEPPRNVEVAGALDHRRWIDRRHRVLSSELMAGERIFARGRLARSDQAVGAGGYRDVEWGWALHAAGGQMLLSSEPLGDGLNARARFHRDYAWLAVFLLVATQLGLVAFYARCAGDTELAVMSGPRHYQTTDSDGDTHEHYVIDVTNPHVGRDTIEIDDDDWTRLHELDGIRVPIRLGSADNWNLGAAPTFHWLLGLVVAAASVGFWALYTARRRSSRPWFRRRVDEQGSGTLPEPE